MEVFERGFTTKISYLLIHTEEQHQNCNLTGGICCTIESLCMCQPRPESLWSAEHRNRLELVTVTFHHKVNIYVMLPQQLSVQACNTWLVQAGGTKINKTFTLGLSFSFLIIASQFIQTLTSHSLVVSSAIKTFASF